jgi:hypothetical protein
MGLISRRAAIAAGTVLLAVGAGATAATIAGGQSGAGPPTGTLSFKVRLNTSASRNGINPAVPRDKKRPKVADMTASNADLLSTDGRKIGVGHDFDVTTYEGAKKYKGKALFYGNAVLDFGSGNFLFEQCVREDSPTNNSCAVIGGTGIYAGARGVAVEDANHGVEDKTNRTFTFTVNVTFVP